MLQREHVEVPDGDPLILVIPDKDDIERDTVAAAWERLGGRVCRVGAFWNPPELPIPAIRLYGNSMFCLVLEQKWGLQLLSPPDDWLLLLPDEYLRRELCGLSLDQAMACALPRFVKSQVPKLFRAAVYATRQDFEDEVRGLDTTTPCLVAEPVRFESEVRCLALKGRIIDGAVYEGTADLTAALHFAQACLDARPMDCPAVLDVGVIEGRGWAALEANPVWGAGLNGCDPERMADCLAQATRPPPHKSLTVSDFRTTEAVHPPISRSQ